MGTSRINRSLKTASLTVARRSVRTIAFEIEREFEVVRNAGEWHGHRGDTFPTTMGVRVEPYVGSAGLTLAAAIDRYLTDPTIKRTKKSQIGYQTTFATVVAIFGAETRLASMTRESCRETLGVLQKLPSNSRKRFPGLLPRQAVEEAIRLGLSGMSASNINEYMNKLSSFFNWAVQEELLHRNPARGLRIAETVMPRDKRHPFALWQLQRIFGAPIYRGCRDDGNGYAASGPDRPRRARFWIPLIALWSGLRQGEICQMLTQDVREIDDVLCFVVSAMEGDGKHLKTAASRRLVPIHPELLKIGFASYVGDRRQIGDIRLFPDLTQDSLGLYSGKFSKWFSRFLRSCDAATDRTCFHAFRHTFRDALREAKIDRDIALTLGGWTTSSGMGAGAVADAYGYGYSPRLLREALALIEYPELDLSHLHVEAVAG